MLNKENMGVSLNLAVSVQNRLQELDLLCTISKDKYFQFSFPDTNVEYTDLEKLAKINGIYFNKANNHRAYINISWFVDSDKFDYSSPKTTAIFDRILNLVPAQMSWIKLISDNKHKSKLASSNNFARTSFEHDIDRIVFSNSFKRLQHKTQVIPMANNDYVHNRLTHSVEVSLVGRDLGRRIIDKLWNSKISINESDLLIAHYSSTLNDEAAKERFLNDIGDIINAACLIHDLGNPPFGHQGEAALSETYIRLISDPAYEQTLQAYAKAMPDLFAIEGNAQTLRIVADNTSIDLSYATLSSVIKYPRLYQDSKNSIYKKFSCYETELELFNQIVESTGLKQLAIDGTVQYARNPLVYLVEAADDICYGLFDFEDFVRLGLISETAFCEALIKIILPNNKSERFRNNGMTIEEQRLDMLNNLADKRLSDKLSKLRSEAMNQLISNACYAFISKYRHIISGVYTKESLLLDGKGKINGLLDIYGELMECEFNGKDAFKEAYSLIKQRSADDGYNDEKVLKNGLGGYAVMEYLLKKFIDALHNLESFNSKMILGILPKQYLVNDLQPDQLKTKKISSISQIEFNEQMLQIRLVNDYLIGMTDMYACSLYRKLSGFEHVSFN